MGGKEFFIEDERITTARRIESVDGAARLVRPMLNLVAQGSTFVAAEGDAITSLVDIGQGCSDL